MYIQVCIYIYRYICVYYGPKSTANDPNIIGKPPGITYVHWIACMFIDVHVVSLMSIDVH